MKSNFFVAIALNITLLTASGLAQEQTAGNKDDANAKEFPKMIKEHPKSLLILPPLTDSLEAKVYYPAIVEAPLATKGYYIIPTSLVYEFMKENNINSVAQLYDMPSSKLEKYFGADAILRTKIEKWDTFYIVLMSGLKTTIHSEIISARTSEILWNYDDELAEAFTDIPSGTSGNALELLVRTVSTTMDKVADANYAKYAQKAISKMFATIPSGPYSKEKTQIDKLPIL